MDYIWAVLRGLPPNWSLIIMSLQPNQKEKDHGRRLHATATRGVALHGEQLTRRRGAHWKGKCL